MKTFNSVIFVLEFLSEIVHSKSSEVIERYFHLLDTVFGENMQKEPKSNFRSNMKKLNLNADLIQIYRNYLFFKVTIKSMDKLLSNTNINQKLIKCVVRKEKDIPIEIVNLKMDYLNTHIVQSLTETSLMSKDYLLQHSRNNWKMIFLLIDEFKNLLKYHKRTDSDEIKSSILTHGF